MSVDQRFSHHEAHLGPDDLRLAAEAFETALLSVQEVACDFPPYRARQLLARYVMERALRGDRDRVQLRQYARTSQARDIRRLAQSASSRRRSAGTWSCVARRFPGQLALMHRSGAVSVRAVINDFAA